MRGPLARLWLAFVKITGLWLVHCHPYCATTLRTLPTIAYYLFVSLFKKQAFQRITKIVILGRSVGGVGDSRLRVVERTRELRGLQRFAVRVLVLQKMLIEGLFSLYINLPGGTLANLRLVGKFLLWIQKISRQCWSASLVLLGTDSPQPSRFLQPIPEFRIANSNLFTFLCARTSVREYCVWHTA